MPIFEYECRACGHEFEVLVRTGDVPACPSCTSQDLKKLLSLSSISSADIRKANPPYIDEVREMIRSTPVNGFIGCAAALAHHDYASAAATVTRPVLFMVGEKDGVAPPAMRKLNEALPGSRYVQLAGAGHISNLDQPEAFDRVLLEFLDSLPS